MYTFVYNHCYSNLFEKKKKKIEVKRGIEYYILKQRIFFLTKICYRAIFSREFKKKLIEKYST